MKTVGVWEEEEHRGKGKNGKRKEMGYTSKRKDREI